MSYLKQRLENFKIENYNEVSIGIPYEMYDHVTPNVQSNYFESDNEDNITINYIDLNGNFQLYEKIRNGKPAMEFFKRTRYKNPVNGNKYKQDFKSGVHIYFTPSIIEKYKQKSQIETLYIVEGEFKAFVTDIHLKLDIIGIGGIHNFADKETNDLHKELTELIKSCKVQNLVLLFDADCLTVKYEEYKDLSKRLYSFFSAVARFRELAQPLKCDTYFSHLHPDLNDSAKGIDDLIIHPDIDKVKLLDELTKLANGNKRQYIKSFSLGRKSVQDLRTYFSIESPESFYKQHGDTIGNKEFIYFKHIYQYNDNKLKLVRHSDAELYMRIGTNYFKRIFNVNKFGEVEENLDKWDISTIKSDYVNNGYKDFLTQVVKYDTFCNMPDNTENYKLVHHIFFDDKISRNYNLYVKPHFIAQHGAYENIYNYLKHITGCNGDDFGKLGDKLTIMMDYFTIMWRYPKNIIPVIALVSKIQKTGKTTLFDLIKSIYGANATILSQDLFDMNFNAHYIQKLIIMLDEVKIESKQQKNKIKQMTTSGKNHIQFKGVDPKEIDTYSKLLLASNDERNFMNIESEDVRFWVLKVPALEKRDPEFLVKMKAEIPAFIYYITSRDIVHPNEDRGWFGDKYMQSDQRDIIISTTKPVIERDIEDFLNNYFTEYPVTLLHIGLQELRDLIVKNSKYSHSKNDIKRTLADIYNIRLSKKAMRFKYITGFKEGITDNIVFNLFSGLGKIYSFDRSRWINEDANDLEVEILNNTDTKTLDDYEYQEVKEDVLPF